MPTMTLPGAGAPTRTLGADLERRRLEQRAVRIEQVLDALRHRAVYRAHTGGVPEPLRQAIAGFDEELRIVRGRLGAGRPLSAAGR